MWTVRADAVELAVGADHRCRLRHHRLRFSTYSKDWLAPSSKVPVGSLVEDTRCRLGVGRVLSLVRSISCIAWLCFASFKLMTGMLWSKAPKPPALTGEGRTHGNPRRAQARTKRHAMPRQAKVTARQAAMPARSRHGTLCTSARCKVVKTARKFRRSLIRCCARIFPNHPLPQHLCRIPHRQVPRRRLT
jgi:hypothetical protein